MKIIYVCIITLFLVVPHTFTMNKEKANAQLLLDQAIVLLHKFQETKDTKNIRAIKKVLKQSKPIIKQESNETISYILNAQFNYIKNSIPTQKSISRSHVPQKKHLK